MLLSSSFYSFLFACFSLSGSWSLLLTLPVPWWQLQQAWASSGISSTAIAAHLLWLQTFFLLDGHCSFPTLPPFLLHGPVDAPYFSICLSSVAIAYLWAACAHAWPVAAPQYMPIAPLWHVLAVIGQTQNTPPPEPFLRLTPFGYYKNNFAYKLRHELSELMQLLLLAISASTLHSLPTLSPSLPPSFAH